MLLFILLFVVLSPGLPSSAARETSASRTTNPQGPGLSVGSPYRQTNLVSDLPGVALVEDRRLRNPWGVGLKSASPFWVVNNKTDLATIYQGDVAGSALGPHPVGSSVAILNVPTFAPAPSLPAGVVNNSTSDFKVAATSISNPEPAQFIFATLNGGINAIPNFGSTAVVVKFRSGHRYTGLTIGSNASGNLLYVADFFNGKIDVFDKDFNETSVSGNFTDPTVPANFHPFNIQNLGGALYVTYAEFSHVNDGDFGFVRKLDTNGVRDTAFAINNGPLANPWGLAIAPAPFGPFSNRLLVGNFRSLGVRKPSISAFDPASGALFGHMVDESGAISGWPSLMSLMETS